MWLAAKVVDWEALGNVIAGSLVLGIGVTGAFSLAILGATRSAEARRDGGSAAAVTFGLLAAVALAACVAVLVLGIIVMTHKS
jgi:hypothetical protein